MRCREQATRGKVRDAANTGRRTATVNLQAEKRTQPHPLFVLIWRSPVPMFLKRPGISSWKPQRSARSNDETPTKMSSNTACGIDTRARKRKRHDGDTQEAIPGLLDDIVVTHVLRSENLDDPAELARLRVVSRGMRNAVAATGRRFVEMDVFHAVKFGCFGTLKRLLRENDPYCASICAEAAKRGHLEMLQWARANGCPWHEGTCWQAALAGRLEVLQWARANGCPWNEAACAHAALGGHLEVLQWARTNGCPWDDWTCTRAAEGGYLEVLQWARANGCPWNALTCLYAAKAGHLEVLQWARANGCEWDELGCGEEWAPRGVAVGARKRLSVGRENVRDGGEERSLPGVAVGACERVSVVRENVRVRGEKMAIPGVKVGNRKRLPVC